MSPITPSYHYGYTGRLFFEGAPLCSAVFIGSQRDPKGKPSGGPIPKKRIHPSGLRRAVVQDVLGAQASDQPRE